MPRLPNGIIDFSSVYIAPHGFLKYFDKSSLNRSPAALTICGVPLQPPYGVIAKYFKEGTIVPFLGAGVNFGTRQPPEAPWTETTTTFLPSGAELSRWLAGDSSFPSQEKHDLDDLAKVASYYVEAAERKGLTNQLHRFFDRDFVPCDIHKYLAEVPTPLLIVTTNYDDLTERAFAAAGREYRPCRPRERFPGSRRFRPVVESRRNGASADAAFEAADRAYEEDRHLQNARHCGPEKQVG